MDYQDYLKSNAAHRRFRQQVGASARRQDKFIRTLKFPLEAPEQGWPLSFDQAQALFNTTEGTGKGSLAGLLFCILLSGGRLFSKGANSQLHRIRSQLPMDAFAAAFEAAFGRENGAFNPADLINYFVTEKRGNTKKGVPFTIETLGGEIYRLGSVNGKLPEQEKVVDESLLNATQLTAELIIQSGVCEWPELRMQVLSCLQSLDTALASLGHNFPQLSSCTAALESMKPDNSTLDFSPIALVADSLERELLPYQVVAAQADMLHQEGEVVDKSALQRRITTETHMAMSWLFNKGLAYWTTHPLERIAEDYQLADEDHWKAARIQEWARAIPGDALFGETKYDKYRSAVGGKLDSWIGNYWARLALLDTVLESLDVAELTLHPDLFTEQAQSWLSGQSASILELTQLIENIGQQKPLVANALGVLRGEAGRLPTQDDIVRFEMFSELLTVVVGEVELLNNRLSQELDKADDAGKAVWKARLIHKPSWLKALPKVPGLSGGVPEYQDEIDQAFDTYQALLKDYLHSVDQVAGEPGWQQIIAAVSSAEQQHLKHHKDACVLDYSSLAVRKLWHQYISQVRKAPVVFQQRVIQKMLDSRFVATIASDHVQPQDRHTWQENQQRKLLNGLIFNQKGRVYVSPFSRARHQAVALDESVLQATNVLDWIADDLVFWQSQSSVEGFRMAHDWKILRARLLLKALPDTLESSVLAASLSLPVPALLRTQLESPMVSAGVVNRLLNLYISEMRGLLAVIFRESFFLRTRFTRVGDNEIFYRPKLINDQWQWIPPEQWLRSSKPAALWVNNSGLLHDDVLAIDSVKAIAKSLGKGWNRGSDVAGPLLKELPHDWCLNLGLDRSFNWQDQSVFALSKTRLGQPALKSQICRLVGNTAFKGWLDKQLTDSSVTSGDYTLIIEQHFKQTLAWQEGRPDISVSKSGMELSVALPIQQEPGDETFDIGQTYIGIDLGEAGIGYAVVSSTSHDLIEFGEIPIPSTQRLISRVKQHRKLVQPRQKFTQRFDASLMQLRENVVGDTAHVINSLMHRFHGVPILESSVRNLASGTKQLQLVYDKVLNLYTYSGTDAHKTARKHFWCGAEQWVDPGVTETVRDGDKKMRSGEPKYKIRDLLLYPGSQVHPAGTSQVCSECGYNPYQLLEVAYKEHRTLRTDGEGILDLGAHQLQLMTRKQANPKHYRRQNIRAPFDQPLANKKLTRDEAFKQVKYQLRRAPDSLRSRDTTQSRYHCVMVGCGHVMHADANAAINIVRKWIHDRAITPKAGS